MHITVWHTAKQKKNKKTETISSYFGIMAFNPKLMPLFDGSDSRQSIVEWFEKAGLICLLSWVKHVECIVLMCLLGSVYAMYQQLSEEKRADIGCIKKTLYTAFAAWKQFAACHLWPGEIVGKSSN